VGSVPLQEHVYVSCPLLRVPPALFIRHESLVWAALEGMAPSETLLRAVEVLQSKIKKATSQEVRQEGGSYCGVWAGGCKAPGATGAAERGELARRDTRGCALLPLQRGAMHSCLELACLETWPGLMPVRAEAGLGLLEGVCQAGMHASGSCSAGWAA
jgi:hypothetical protein